MWTVLTLHSGNSLAQRLAKFPVGADMQQIRPSSNTRLAMVFNKSDFPKIQIYKKFELSCQNIEKVSISSILKLNNVSPINLVI